MRLSTAALAAFAILAFAGNSLTTRAALVDGAIGWEAFTAIRLVAGAVTLVLLAAASRSGWRAAMPKGGDWPGVVSLALYAVLFSAAYLRLGVASGALILFAMVQATMVAVSIARGHAPNGREWAGLAIAGAGLIWLLLPGAAAPDAISAAMMAGAGIAWGAYTLLGQGAGDPLARTARNFAGTVPLGLLLALFALNETASADGIVLAIVSGAVTSGLGYAVWYAVLPRMTTSLAAILQLLVPAVAAIGGAVWLGEALGLRIVGATGLIMAGIAMVVLGRAKPRQGTER